MIKPSTGALIDELCKLLLVTRDRGAETVTLSARMFESVVGMVAGAARVTKGLNILRVRDVLRRYSTEAGMSVQEIHTRIPELSEVTLRRRLTAMVGMGEVEMLHSRGNGQGRAAIRYAVRDGK